MKWNISCHISKRECHSYPQFQPSTYGLVSPKGIHGGEVCLLTGYINSLKTGDQKLRRLAPESWDAYERKDFSKLGLLHLPIHSASVHAKLLQSRLILCDPMDCSLLGSSVYGILQVRILEWVVMPISRGSSWPRDQTLVSCLYSGRATKLPSYTFET